MGARVWQIQFLVRSSRYISVHEADLLTPTTNLKALANHRDRASHTRRSSLTYSLSRQANIAGHRSFSSLSPPPSSKASEFPLASQASSHGSPPASTGRLRLSEGSDSASPLSFLPLSSIQPMPRWHLPKRLKMPRVRVRSPGSLLQPSAPRERGTPSRGATEVVRNGRSGLIFCRRVTLVS